MHMGVSNDYIINIEPLQLYSHMHDQSLTLNFGTEVIRQLQ